LQTSQSSSKANAASTDDCQDKSAQEASTVPFSTNRLRVKLRDEGTLTLHSIVM
jgi:hypothetical protein